MQQHASTSLQQPQPHSPGAIVLRTLSKEQQSKWIERVFAKLLSIYGDRFSSIWAHTDAGEVKSTWADALGGFDAETLGAALKACYDEPHCPKLPDFISLCRQKARRTYQQQDVPPVPTAQAAAILAEAQKRANLTPKSEKYNYRAWATRISEKQEAGHSLIPVQIQMAKEALGVKE